MTARIPLRRLRADRRGTTVVEFALLLVPLMVILLGTLDLGYYAYVRAMVQGALQTASRSASIANKTPAQIDAAVKATLGPIVPSQYVTTTVRSYYDYTRVAQPEKLIDDKNHNGQYDPGDCFEDANDNGVYDKAPTAGRNSGGNADEVVAYTINVDYPRLMSMGKLLGWSSVAHVTGTTMLRNQPFAPDVPVRTVCG